MMRVIVLLCVAAVACGQDSPVPMPADGRDVLIERVSLHEYRGKVVAIEESTDAPKRTTAPAPKSTPKKAKPQANQGGDAVTGITLSPVPAPPVYKQIGGYWYRGDGDDWVLLPTTASVTARSVPQSHPTIPATTVLPVAVPSMSYPVGMRTARTPIGVGAAINLGVISAGACIGGG